METWKEYLAVLKRFQDFSGRSSRSEFWSFFFCSSSVAYSLYVLEEALGWSQAGSWGPLTSSFLLVNLPPGLAVLMRRLHDTGRNAVWLLVALVPTFGGFLLLALMALEGQAGENQYGPDPKPERGRFAGLHICPPPGRSSTQGPFLK